MHKNIYWKEWTLIRVGEMFIVTFSLDIFDIGTLTDLVKKHRIPCELMLRALNEGVVTERDLVQLF